MRAISLSTSFSSYSNCKVSKTAGQAVDEFDYDEFSGEFYFASRGNSAAERGECEDEFEFAIVVGDTKLPSPISADEIFQNGKIRPVYPVFKSDLLMENVKFPNENENKKGVHSSVSPSRLRRPLRKLFLEERETKLKTSSSSSSEGDDLNGVTAESYCVRPSAAAEDGCCKKSNSTGGTSKRWKLRDFLHRSNSDEIKNTFVVLSHRNSGRKMENLKKVAETAADGRKVRSTAPQPPRNLKGSEKQWSYLPCKPDVVGFFGNVYGLRKNMQSH